MEIITKLTTVVFITVFIFNGYQKCAAYPEKEEETKPPTQPSTMDIDSKEKGTTTVKKESDIVKDDIVYRSLPPHLKPFNEQLAGRGMGPYQIGILRDKNGNLYKPIHPNARGEITFYEALKEATDSTIKELQEFVPKYLGTEFIQIGDENVEFLHLEDIMKDYKLPCSIDIKIKHLIWDPPFEEDRPLRYKAMTDAYGFGITGFKYFDIMTGEDERNDRHFVYRMLPHEGIQTFYKFVNGEIGLKCGIVHRILQQLNKIRAWFEKQEHYIFNNNSVLLTYDAKTLADYVRHVKESAKNGNPNKDCSNFNVPVHVNLVFFGKVVPVTTPGQKDEQYLYALKTLIPMLNNISQLNAESYYDPLLSAVI